MIKGERKIKLTPDVILNKISEYDIFMRYMPSRDWKLNSVTYSPFREETNPSFMVGNWNGSLYFIDFADGNKRGGCFDFVEMRFGLSFNEALVKIDFDFGIGILSTKNLNSYKTMVSQYRQPESIGKRYSLIQIVTRKFTKIELDYWTQYGQSIDDLRANHIYSIDKVFLNRKRFSVPESELRFGYLYEGGFWKIYRPFAKIKRRKWISNVPLTTVYGLKNLHPDKNTLICKSLKDYLVCIKVHPNTCHVQNESMAAFSTETVEYIQQNSKDVYYGGDSDKPGKDASYIITQAFGFKHINPPDRLLPENKDFADWAMIEGSIPIKEHFINKKLM